MNVLNKFLKEKSSKRFFNAIMYGIGGAILSKGFLMLFNIIIARIIGETQYGVYSIINNTVQTFTVFAGAGIGVTLTRYVALYREKNKKMAGIVIKTLLIFNLILSLIISILMFSFSQNISKIISEQVDITMYLKITSITIFFTSVALILQSILQGFEKFKKVALIQVISNLLMLVIGIVLTKIFNIIGTIIALVVLQIIMTIFFIITIKRILKEKEIILKFEINNIVRDAIKNVAIPAFLSSIFVVPILWFTNFIFTKNNGYEEFAAFSVCLQWFTILNYIPQQFGQVKPIYTQMYDDGNLKELKKAIYKIMKFSVCFIFCVALVLGIGSKILLGMYGDYYLNYIIPFIIMLVSSIFFSIQAQYGGILQAIGKIWSCLILNFIWAIVFVICFFCFNKMGAIGYTLTYLISYVIYSIVSLIYFVNIMSKRKEEIKNEN